MQATTVRQQKDIHVADAAMDTWSDEALISWYCSKQPKWRFAFAALETRHRPWIFRVCLFRLGNHHDAEDATQDIVLRVYNNLQQFQGRSQFKTWVNTIIVNYCNTFAVRRSKYVTSDHIEQLIELHEEAEFVTPYDALAEQELVRQAVFSLPENARQVLNLRFYGQYSLEEIARILCLPLSTTKARLYRAIEQFKILYFQLGEEKSSPCTS